MYARRRRPNCYALRAEHGFQFLREWHRDLHRAGVWCWAAPEGADDASDDHQSHRADSRRRLSAAVPSALLTWDVREVAPH
jgi:hypothetical protein